MQKELISISFPNNAQDSDANFYTKGGGCFFKRVNKDSPDETWIQVWKGSEETGAHRELIAEVRENICNLYY